MQERILIVEDDPDIVELLQYNLGQAGFATDFVLNGTDAIEQAIAETPDLIVLDLLLPGTDGLEVCRLLRRHPATGNVPIVMVTAKGEETDRIVGLELGADDYIPKPFSPRELVLRVRAVLRRTKSLQPTVGTNTIRVHGLTLDLDKHRLSDREGKEIEVTATEFKMLSLMADSPGRVFTRSILMDQIWGQDYYGIDRTVDTHVSRLRRKLGEHGELIETVQGVGYRFRE